MNMYEMELIQSSFKSKTNTYSKTLYQVQKHSDE